MHDLRVSVHQRVLRTAKRYYRAVGRDLLEHHPRAEVGAFLDHLAIDDEPALVAIFRIDAAADDQFGSIGRQAFGGL